MITKRTYRLKSAKSLWDLLILYFYLRRKLSLLDLAIRQMAKGLKPYSLVLHLKTEEPLSPLGRGRLGKKKVSGTENGSCINVPEIGS